MIDTKQQKELLCNFYKDVFGYSFGLPDNLPSYKEDQVLLYLDSGISTLEIFEIFSKFNCSAKKSGSPNTIDKLILKKLSQRNLFNINPNSCWPDYSYFFVVDKGNEKEENFLVTPNFDIGGFSYLFSEDSQPPASIEEIVVFHLFSQWSGQWSGIPNNSVITSTGIIPETNLEKETLAILEFDEDNLSTCIRFFEKTPREGRQLITKKVFERVVY